ncbi:MAG: hypothetical protein M1830_008942 [Pleopsidium flavum]|nr:MAG: hypothetical protein M1830_008942 [Pleopsidium flavum]
MTVETDVEDGSIDICTVPPQLSSSVQLTYKGTPKQILTPHVSYQVLFNPFRPPPPPPPPIMKSITIAGLSILLAGPAVQANYMCPVMPSSSDAAAISFGLTVQTLLSDYYKSVPVNATFFSTLPSNPMPATDYLGNVMGLAQQAVLGVTALQELSATISTAAAAATKPMPMPMCNYNYPPVTDAKSHLMNAYQIEATLCGTFIGLADYVQSPQAAFLMARLAAEHGIHASYIGSHMQPQVFMANSTMLTPAFTPEMVLMSGMEVGMLGQYLNGCASAPPAPCGGMVTIGMLGSNLTGQGSGNASGAATPTMGMYPTAATTTGMAVFTGAAQRNWKGVGGAVGGAALAAVVIM